MPGGREDIRFPRYVSSTRISHDNLKAVYSNATVERDHATSGTERSRMPNRSVWGYLWARLDLFSIPVFCS